MEGRRGKKDPSHGASPGPGPAGAAGARSRWNRHRSSPFFLALSSGLLIGLSFPISESLPFAPLAWFGFVPLLVALHRTGQSFRRHAFLAFAAMVLFNFVSACWLLLATAPGALLLWLPHAFLNAVPLLLLHPLRRRLGWTRALIFLPFFWTAWEWLHTGTEFSFPWLIMGNTQSVLPFMTQFAEYGGVWGVSFWVMSLNALLAAGFTAAPGVPAHPGRRKAFAAAALLLAAPALHSGFVLQNGTAEPGTRPVRVGIVQPNVDPFQKWEFEQFPSIMRRLFALTDRTVVQGRPDLLVWPETAIPYYILMESVEGQFRGELEARVRGWGTPLLTGFSDAVFHADSTTRRRTSYYDEQSGRWFDTFNSAMVMQPGGRDPRVYHKVKLVPFGERVPYSDLFPFLATSTFSIAGLSWWERGEGPMVLPLVREGGDTVGIAPLICFEALYPAYAAGFVERGAGILAVITNDGWFGRSHALVQHAAFARLRAIETRRPIVRCGNTGVSFFVDRWGKTSGTLPWWEERSVTQDVTPGTGVTFFVRHPDLVPQACLAASLLFMAAALLRFRRGSPESRPELSSRPLPPGAA
jgi:apolipoprotein N-acyltransferase